jgi:sigma-B regulation protein RsbU (phosphoserine phosphatase)
VPVTCGNADNGVTLGALLIMDKRANAYSTSVHLGSQETKFAISIASMVGSVLGARKVAQVDKELRLAEAIQQQILPERPASVAGFDLAGRCHNYGAVGGDYYDYLPMGDGRTLVVVADVSGHNLASGMLMVNARSTLRALAAAHDDLALVFDQLASALYHDLTKTELFITAVAAALRPGRGEVELVNAGHNDAMLYRAKTGQVERFPSDGMVLGFLPEQKHDLRSALLEPGDVLLLYTDGVVEATAPTGEMLGEARLEQMLRQAAGGSAGQVLQAVFRGVDAFSNQSAKTDDVTAVVIKVVPEEASGA